VILEVEVGPDQGLSETSVIACDSIITIPTEALHAKRVGHLDPAKRVELDRAIRYALDIAF
jgi:mRNA interferase MazF